jgi:ABC-type glycerol-3-phosphate transport system substrate-binding protein
MALALGAAMLLSMALAACGSGGAGGSTTAASEAATTTAATAATTAEAADSSEAATTAAEAATTAAETAAPQTETAAPDEAAGPESIPVTVFIANARVESDFSNLTKEYVNENFGLDISFISGVDNWQQKYALLVSGGDIPSFSVLPAAQYYEYASQGAYADLTDIRNNYANIMGYVTDDLWPRVTVDGRIYAIPGRNTAGKWVVSYRQDWLDNLGLKVPVTYDEYVEVMRAFTEDDPDGNGANDTYGYSSNTDAYGNIILHMFYGMYGAAPEYYHVVGDEVEIDAVSEGYKQALITFKDLYDKKYVDPEVFTQKGEQFWQKLVQGKFGSWVGWWSELSGAYSSYGFEESQPGGVLVSGPAVIGPTGMSGMTANDPMDTTVAISYKFEDPDRVLKYLDWCTTDYGYRVSRYGVEGKGFTLDANGDLDYLYSRDPDRKMADGTTVEGDPEIFCFLNRIDLYPQQLLGDTIAQQKAYEGYVSGRDNPLLLNDFLGLTSEEFQNTMPDIKKYVDEMLVKFVLGDESFDNWDAYVKEYIRLGGLEVAESLLAEYNAFYGASAHIKNYQ